MMMISRNNIKKEIKDSSFGEKMVSGSEFWSDFKKRLGMYPQAAPAKVQIAPVFFRRAIAAGCMALVLMGISYYWMLDPLAGITQIQSVDVVASHSAVLILEDEAGEGVILWVVDMEAEG